MNQVPLPTSELTLAATPNAVAWARRHTVDILQRWRFPAEGIEVARLLVSELATNAIQHARLAEIAETAAESASIGTILLRLWPTDGGIILAVSDPDPRPPVPRADDARATGGRGLVLIQAMANRWGYFPTQPLTGKVVWAEVPSHPRAALRESGGPEITPLVMGRALVALRDL
ncbi:ATP-binding protein [Streptomyces sp. NPDC057271]|uniref:ATP-binding protein n=1 Tax=unclassified Streptomyces TaxID=2593676 RepID=UPI003639826F